MRVSLAVTFVAGGLVLGCSRDAVRPPPPAPVDWHSFAARPRGDAAAAPAPNVDARTLAERYAAALAAPDFGQLARDLDPDAHFFFPGIQDVHGREAVLRAHELVFGAFSERRTALRRVLRTTSVQLLQWTLAGVQTSDWFDATAADRSAVFDGLTVLSTHDGGNISDVHVYFDVASVKAQLGSAPTGLHVRSPAPWPTGPAQVLDQNGSSDEMQNTAVVRGWLDALESIDRTAYLASLAKEVEVRIPEKAEPELGKEAAATYFDAIHRQLAELDTQIDGIWAVGDFVGCEYSISGQQIAPIGWVPLVRDRVVRLEIADVVELHDGRITHVWRYDNLAEANAPGP